VPLNTLLQAQARVLPLLPADVQRVGNTMLYVSSQLHAHAQLPAVDAPVTPLANVDTQVLVAASAAPRTFKPSLYATSLLAAAPQLSSSLGGSSIEPLAKPDCTTKEYYSWWTGALSQADSSAHLTGHSVSMTLGLAPLLSTAVGQTRVDVHLLDRNIRVYVTHCLAPCSCRYLRSQKNACGKKMPLALSSCALLVFLLARMHMSSIFRACVFFRRALVVVELNDIERLGCKRPRMPARV
jgi:hypothetical protein